ncbi:hypothetical protein FHL15_011286 [Xylaria flabelliformis]|uniref:Major facilitator superfamily (MFS) profile domain-containing protein n=1 Tax=Xylaria flabelliformis TaxID=2512241 RepID=A0A553HIR4_9PEZI|nr:hypothetical protein FHL15_011286 [Xylaria flabelliformis]
MLSTAKSVVASTSIEAESSSSRCGDDFYRAARGEVADVKGDQTILGFDNERMRARTSLTAEEEKSLLRRIDWHLMPLCSLIFLFKNLDVDNIPYIVGEAPSNLLLKWFSPSRWQSRIMISWGIVLALHVPIVNKQGLYAVRFFLGLAEAAVCWHLVLIKSLEQVDYQGGSVPETASWLTDKEKAFIQARLPENAPRAAEQDFNFGEILSSLKDKRLWLFTLIWALFTVGTSGVRFYQPTVIANLGFTTIAQAQLLNLPISVFGLLVIFVTGYFADNGRLPRPIYPLTFLIIIIASYSVLVVYPSNGSVYAATLIGNAVTAAWYPMMWPWRVQTTSRATGSAFSIGFVNSYGQIGGAIGPQIFRSAYAPKYTVPFGIAAGLVGACAITTVITWWVTRQTESDTRRLKRARISAGKRGEAILNDVVDTDLKGARI